MPKLIRGGYSCLLTIGNNVTITNAQILLHDASTKKEIGYTKVGRVTIGDNVFIGLNSVILPGTTIGSRVIVGAGCVVAHDIPDNSVVVGNPCRLLCSYDDYISKQKEKLEHGLCLNLYPQDLLDQEHYDEKKQLIQKGSGYFL